jgi:deazaflavin-dependent oxidoreductase (nitroreductase family)
MNYISKSFMTLYIGLYRLSSGRLGGQINGFKVLLLNTIGRKTGKERTAALGSFEKQGGFVIVASNNGEANNPAWYHNLRSNPKVTIQIMDKIIPATAEVLTGDARSQAWQQVITTAPLYANYEKRTKREIPLILLRPS